MGRQIGHCRPASYATLCATGLCWFRHLRSSSTVLSFQMNPKGSMELPEPMVPQVLRVPRVLLAQQVRMVQASE